MTEDAGSHAYEAERALSRARKVGESTAAAARRAVRRHMLLLGAATALAVPLSGLVNRTVDPATLRTVLIGAIWGGLFGAVVQASGTQPVRALVARRKMVVIAVASGLVVGAAMGVGYDLPAAYLVGAAAVFGVWVLGAWWAGR